MQQGMDAIRSFRETMNFQPTLVVADDDPDHAHLLSAWLEHQGYRVLRFDSGDELVEWASHSPLPVDAFLLDYEMPGRDGLSSCRELRERYGYTETPAVLVSGARLDVLSERMEGAKLSGVVRKDAAMLANLSSWLADNLQRRG
jgi:CheY-like chemotaxis protein